MKKREKESGGHRALYNVHTVRNDKKILSVCVSERERERERSVWLSVENVLVADWHEVC